MRHWQRQGVGLAAALSVAVLVGASTLAAESTVRHDDPAAGAAAPAATLDASVWPRRWGFEPGGVQGIVLASGEHFLSLRPGRVPGIGQELVDDETDRADIAAFLDAAAKGARNVQLALELGGSFIFRAKDPAGPGPGPEVIKFISGTPEPARDGEPERVALQRTWFALYEPAGEKGKTRRGIALVIPGMFGTPEPMVEGLVGALRSNGWSVLRMLSHPSRFTERLELKIDPDAPETAAALAAEVFSDRTAECAYAAQAALAWVEKERPNLAAGLRIAVGMSGGAMVLPTVIAREPEKYAAAVLIAGGVNFLNIITASNYTKMIDAVRPEWLGGPPTEDQLRAFGELYLKAARLDAFHTAELLRGMPVLVLHGEADKAVPAELGELLWERLGKPERWSYPVGHEALFMMLPLRYNQIAAWINKATETAAEAPSPTRGGTASSSPKD